MRQRLELVHVSAYHTTRCWATPEVLILDGPASTPREALDAAALRDFDDRGGTAQGTRDELLTESGTIVEGPLATPRRRT